MTSNSHRRVGGFVCCLCELTGTLLGSGLGIAAERTPPETKHKRLRRTQLHHEQLEPRIALSGDALVEIGTQPVGALSGKIVYTHAGHGWTANNLSGGAWSTQRPETFDMVEDLGNQDQMTFLVDYLFRAGATVVPLRPVGHQPNEVVLDNDDPGVQFVGNWSDSSASVYFGSSGDVPYRFANTSATETAFARYRPNIPENGFYPVYAWTRYGSDRAADQLYRVRHSGGITEVTVNHRRVGNGLVYLGTYYFQAGSEGYVDISNRSSESGQVVIADMIRFGNGMGDINRGGGVSGKTREDEAGLYWVKWHVDRAQGIPDSEYRSSSDDRSATVSLSPRYAEYMNRSNDGSLSDRVFVSFHSNAGGGSARGVLALYNGNNTPSSATPNQLFLANTLGREVNNDLVAQNGQFEHNWGNRTTVTLDRSDIEFGEINNTYINNEFDATIVETAFHDNQLDAELMRDPKVRDALGRATYQGVVKYFRGVDDGATPLVLLPGPVSEVRSQSAGEGSVTLSWKAPVANSYKGDAAAGYRIYTSLDGYGFDGGTYVDGGTTTTHTLAGLDAADGVHYFKIVAVNAGGESVGSEVVAALPNGGTSKILIVNGFDRLDRTLNPVQPYLSGQVDRVRPRWSNSRDYAVQVAEAIEAYGPDTAVDTASNESIALSQVALTDYEAVVWILGEESSGDNTFDMGEQLPVIGYLGTGGRLLVSGAETGWDLDFLNNGREFYNQWLKAEYVADDANTYSVRGDVGSIFEGLSFSFDNGSKYYDAQFPDVVNPNGGTIRALSYVGGTGGGAGVQFDAGPGQEKVVNFGFPFETITTESARQEVMARVLEFFEISAAPVNNVELILDNDTGFPTFTEAGIWFAGASPGYDGGTYRYANTGDSALAVWNTTVPFAGQAEFFVQYRADTNRATNAAFSISTGLATESASVNQQLNNLQWVSLGSFPVAEGTVTIVLNAANSSGGDVVIADAVRIDLTRAASGDFDADGDYSCTDVDALVAEIVAGTHDTSFDLTADGLVDVADLSAWLAEAGAAELPSGNPYLLGDANLDGFVDTSDFNLWNANKFTSVASWCSGDFNADGFVDASDFNLWNSNKFSAADNAPVFVRLDQASAARTEHAVVTAPRAVRNVTAYVPEAGLVKRTSSVREFTRSQVAHVSSLRHSLTSGAGDIDREWRRRVESVFGEDGFGLRAG